jgi:general secretion pathway protein G
MRRAQAGFTLIELVITVAIIGLLASIAAPLTETVVRRGKEQELKAALMSMRDAIDAYKDAAESGRIERPVGESGYPRSLEVLVTGMTDKRSPAADKIYFLRRIPRDPFSDPALPAGQTWGLRSYESPPDSPRPGKDVFDIYSRSEGKALDGSSYREW